MHVGSADAGEANAYENFVVADAGFGNIPEDKTAFRGGFDQRFHWSSCKVDTVCSDSIRNVHTHIGCTQNSRNAQQRMVVRVM